MSEYKKINNIRNPSYSRRLFSQLNPENKLKIFPLLSPQAQDNVGIEMMMNDSSLRNSLLKNKIKEMSFEEFKTLMYGE